MQLLLLTTFEKAILFQFSTCDIDIIKMLEFFIDNIFAMFDGRVFQQTVGIPMATNCVPLLVDLFLYSY